MGHDARQLLYWSSRCAHTYYSSLAWNIRSLKLNPGRGLSAEYFDWKG